MPDPLSLIPSGSQYNALRWTLRILQKNHRRDYGGLVNQPDRVRGWVSDIDRGVRSADDIRDSIVLSIIGFEEANRVYGIDQSQFDQLVLGSNEGGIDLGGLTVQTPPAPPASAPPPAPSTPTPPASPPPPAAPPPVPEPEPVDFRARVQALYPWLPDPLVGVFADAWDETGDAQTALAEMRASSLYDQFYPGNRRDDGTLRHTEAEYASIKDAFRTLYREFNLNPAIFEDRFTELIEKDQSPMEHAARLGAAKEQIIDTIPQVREVYARYGNIAMTDEAIFASVIDPNIGDAIRNRRISVAQVGGEALARGFDITQDFAGRLASGGVGQEAARTLFATAEGELADLNELVRRHRDPDDTFDLEEFADAHVFGNAEQNDRIQRALRAEAASFTEQIGTVATSDDSRVSGLTAR